MRGEHESRAIGVVEANENMLVPWILMTAYAYYELNTNLVSDHTYDKWCRLAHYRWRFLHHRHKELITRGKTTCMVLIKRKDYPSICRHAATAMVDELGLGKRRS